MRTTPFYRRLQIGLFAALMLIPGSQLLAQGHIRLPGPGGHRHGSTPTAARPVDSPGAGTYSGAQTITITTATGGATICYTTDGSNPAALPAGTCSHGSTYSIGFTSPGATFTLKSLASKSGYFNSSIQASLYTITVTPTAATPVDAPGTGTYSAAQTVTITTGTAGATICYTTNGSNPTAPTPGTCSTGSTYAGAFTSPSSTFTLKALATKSGYLNSALDTSTYTITPTVATPIDSPGTGTYAGAQTVTITVATSGATICYTVDGSTPAASSPGTCSAGSTYSAPFTSPSSTFTLKALGTKAGSINSGVHTSLYTINPTASTPVDSPGPGTYPASQTVTISTGTAGATICYTVDGSTPAATTPGTCSHGSTYAGGFASPGTTFTLKALASKTGFVNSAVDSSSYVIESTVFTPVDSPGPGTYSGAQTVTLTTGTAGATICYTVDGSLPAASTPGTCSAGLTYSTPFTSPSSTFTLRALGSKAGYFNSPLDTSLYTINPTAATPVDHPGAGSYSGAQTVTLTTATGGATICYTTDGSTPAASMPGTCSTGNTYAGAFTSPSVTFTLKALATKTGYFNSGIDSSLYTINSTVATPVDSPGTGSYSGAQTVTITVATSGATICYTVDGSTPAASTPGTCSAGSTYSAPFTSPSSTFTLKALGTKSGSVNSGVDSSVYTITGSTCAIPGISTCYYIAATGNDANAGTSQAVPWQHAPGMPNCSGTCHATTPAGGKGFIFRGGDTWHFGNSAATPYVGAGSPGWNVTWTGSSGAPIYWGVNQSWYTGASWTRPIMTGDNPTSSTGVAACLYDQAIYTALNFATQKYNTFDNLNFTGFCWHGNQSNSNEHICCMNIIFGSQGNTTPSYNTLENLYIHGWSHVTFSCSLSSGEPTGNCNGATAINLGSNSNYEQGDQLANNVIDGQDTDQHSICAICFGGYDIHNNVIRYTGNGVVTNNTHVFHDNQIEFIHSSDGVDHVNVAKFNSEWNGVNAHYNNVFANNFPGGLCGVSRWLMPSSTDYDFNNVQILGQCNQNWMDLAITYNTGWTVNIFNETWSLPTNGGTNANPVGTTTNWYNVNTVMPTGTAPSNCFSGAGTLNYLTDLCRDPTVSNPQYPPGATFPYSPNAGAAGIGTGTNLQTFCTALLGSSDPLLQAAGHACQHDTTFACAYNATNHTVSCPARTPNTWPSSGAWDIGAYKYP